MGPMQSFINPLAPAQLQVRSLSTTLDPALPRNVGQKRPRLELDRPNATPALQGSYVSEPLQFTWQANNTTHHTAYNQPNVLPTSATTNPVIMGWPGDTFASSITPANVFETLLWPPNSPSSKRQNIPVTLPSSPNSASSSRPTSSHSLPSNFMSTSIPPENVSSSYQPLTHQGQQQRPACSRTHFSHVKSHSSLGALSSLLGPEKPPKRARHLPEGPDSDPSKPGLALNQGIRTVSGVPDLSLSSDTLKLNLTPLSSLFYDDGARAPARVDPPHSSSIQAGANALFALLEERLYAGAKAMDALFQDKIKKNEEELEGKKRWIMDETRTIGEERKKLEEERRRTEEISRTSGELPHDVGEGRQAIEEERKVLEERRMVLDEEKRILDEAHAKLEEYFKLTQEDRQKVAEERRSLEEEKNTLTEGRRLLETDRNTFNQERQQLEQQRQEIERERTVIDNERKVVQAIRLAVEEEQRLRDESKKGLQDERDKLLSDWASLDSQKVALLEGKAEIAQRMEAAEEEWKIVEVARHQTEEEKRRLEEERERIEEERMSLQEERRQADEVRSALREERAALDRSKMIVEDTRRVLEEKRKAVDEGWVKLEKKLEQDRVALSSDSRRTTGETGAGPRNPRAPPIGLGSVGPMRDTPYYPRGRYHARGGSTPHSTPGRGTFESRSVRR
ncbi:unnamed protein product [Cyclocybe aegerita]|uniref:Uncharacterized protein n=1 Tax=Cyclocybe aegerita TaxID=1973307 RepID=A0A8S0W687_CYCAE|nr:unnamed protein product [Cyclocybe aegerita]